MQGLDRRFDVIVVGAGPAGLSAAYILAKKGFHVVLLERGRGIGSKQVFGGRVYSSLLERVFGSLGDAPIHRWVRRERLSIINDERMLTVEYVSGGKYSFTTYLGQLASWMAGKAVEAGAIIVDEVRVDRILVEDNSIVGVESGSDTLKADVVVDAEGANRLLLEELGLVEKPRPHDMALGVKEVIKLGEKKIEEKFGLRSGEGVAWILAGSVSAYAPGGGFIYTNKDSVSIGVVVSLRPGGLVEEPYRLVESMRLNPLLKDIWKEGDIIEYSAHMVPERSIRLIPSKLALNNFLVVGDAAGLLLNTGYTIRGVDYAAYSGYLAANAIIEAEEKYGSYSEEVLRRLYEDRLKRSMIFRDIARHKAVEMMWENPTMIKQYAALLLDTLGGLYELGESTPSLREAFKNARRKNKVSLIRVMADLIRGVMKA